MKPKPISVIFKQREPNAQERTYGPEPVLEARLDFHYFTGKEWKGQSHIHSIRMTKNVVDNMQLQRNILENEAWNWLIDNLKAEKIGSEPILMIADKPITIKEE